MSFRLAAELLLPTAMSPPTPSLCTSSAIRKSPSSKAKRITASMHSRVCTCPGVWRCSTDRVSPGQQRPKLYPGALESGELGQVPKEEAGLVGGVQ